ncbi:MAG: hypothetical protein AAF827_20135, partial [Cyanobacteria bacterium P01_D01_bin.6]
TGIAVPGKLAEVGTRFAEVNHLAIRNQVRTVVISESITQQVFLCRTPNSELRTPNSEFCYRATAFNGAL